MIDQAVSTFQVVQICLGSGGVLGIVYLIFKMGGLCKTIEVNTKAVESHGQILFSIQSDLRSINDRLTRLEVRVEERTLKVVHVEKTGTEERKK